jgi:hypothetical protein
VNAGKHAIGLRLEADVTRPPAAADASEQQLEIISAHLDESVIREASELLRMF